MSTRYIVLFFFLMLMVGTVNAQQEAGDSELQLAGSFLASTGVPNVSFSSAILQTKIGKFFTDNFEIGIVPSLQWTRTAFTTTQFSFVGGRLVTSEVEEVNEETTFGGGAFLTYSFLTSGATTVPYFGAQYYKQSFKDSEDNGSVGANVGMKFFFTKKAAFDVSGNYLFSLNKDAEGGLILITFGMSFLL